MARRLQMTQALRERITAAFEDVEPDKVAVFEAEVLNTLPVNKKGTIFDRATHTAKTLHDMAAVFNEKPLSMHVPLHMNHDQGYGMPIGQVFNAGVFEETGVTRLRAQFFLPLASEADTIDKLDTGTYNETSVGNRYKSILCSECGWDFLGKDATSEHLWSRTCENGHTLGEEGVHLNLAGLDRWLELSVVSIGAAQKANIASRTRALLGESTYNQLAANGIDPSQTTLYAGATKPANTEKPKVELTQLVNDYTAAKVTLSQREATIVTKDAEIASLTAQVATLNTEKAALTTTKTETDAKLSAAELELKALKETDHAKAAAELSEVKSFIRSEADRLCVALGVAPIKADATLAELKASIEENRVKMGHRFTPQDQRTTTEGFKAAPSAFKTK